MNDYSDVANINIGDLNRYTQNMCNSSLLSSGIDSQIKQTTPIYNVWSPNLYNTYTGGYCVTVDSSQVNSIDVSQELKGRIDKLEADNDDLLKRISQLEMQLHYELCKINKKLKDIGALPDISDMV